MRLKRHWKRRRSGSRNPLEDIDIADPTLPPLGETLPPTIPTLRPVVLSIVGREGGGGR
jgi:hypothetical protein